MRQPENRWAQNKELQTPNIWGSLNKKNTEKRHNGKIKKIAVNSFLTNCG